MVQWPPKPSDLQFLGPFHNPDLAVKVDGEIRGGVSPGAEAPFTAKTSPFFGENAFKSLLGQIWLSFSVTFIQRFHLLTKNPSVGLLWKPEAFHVHSGIFFSLSSSAILELKRHVQSGNVRSVCQYF